MQASTKVLMLAPVLRNWGNRVVRESESLSETGYSVTAMMQCEQPISRNGVDYVCAPPAKGRLNRFVKLPLVLWFAIRFRAHIYHLHNPDMLPLAFCLRLLGKRVVYDTHEDYSRRLLMREWIPPYFRKPLSILISSSEQLLSHVVNAVFVTQENQLDDFSKRTYLLRNAPFIPLRVKTEVEYLSADIKRDPDIYRLIYAGGISKERGLFVMMEALQALNDKGIPTRLWLIGPELNACLDEAKKMPGWKFVDYIGLQSQEIVFAYMKQADVGLVILGDIGDHSSARPSKLFEYMAWGLPFIASDFECWKSFVGGKGGVWIQPDNAAALSDALKSLYYDVHSRDVLSNEGKVFFNEFNWGGESKILLDTYKTILL
ncbi:glycosyltransferase [Halomonas sp. M20]|uniref:glycosyltransferase n=1 Tax=Halomonas sp. M20 TaxID=2763264 RepID=UPI001D0A6EED|nr:glycosyltransferase [Halomonas sp. M20]